MKKRLLPIIIILLALVTLMIGGCSGKETPIERIALTSLPKLEYLKGETFDLSNSQFTVYYANGTTKTLPLTFEMISNYDPQDIGEHVLTIKYENVFTNIKIKISNAPIVRIEPTKRQIDYKTEYIEDQELSLENLYLKIYYESGDPDTIPVTEDMVTGFNPDIVGEQQLTIKYLEFQTTLTIKINQKTVTSISIAETPDKELYLVDEKITRESLAGGRLFVNYDNGNSEYIPFPDLYATQEELDAALSYDSSYAKSREVVTLSYGGKAVIFAIKVLEKEAVTFTILSMPSEIQIVGTDLSLRGGQLSVDYNNLTTEVFSMTDPKVIATGYDKTRVGIQTVTLSFTDIKKTFSFQIEVVETKPSSLEILPPVVEDGVVMRYSQAGQEKTNALFYEEGVVDLSLWEYRLIMDNGSYSAIYPVDINMLKGDAGRLVLDEYGTRTFEFEYNRDERTLTKAVQISILKKELVRITVTPPTNNIFYARAELVLTGARYTAFFNDGTTEEGDITRDMVSGYNNSQPGNQDVIVTYSSEKYGTKMSSFKVLVIRKAVSIQFISIFKDTYVLGESFDIQGLEMRIHYEGSTNSEPFIGPFGNEWVFENTQFDTLGHHSVIVKYQATGLTLETTIPVYVKNDLVSIELVKFVDGEYIPAENLPQVVAGMEIDFTDYYLDCTLENGSTMVALVQIMTDYQRTDKTAGQRNVNINYGGLSIQTTLNVIERQIASLQLLSAPQKHYYKAGQPAALDITGLSMKLNYTNMTSISLHSGTLTEQNEDNLVYRFANELNQFEYITLSITPFDTELESGVETAVRTIIIAIESFEVSFDIVVAYKIATSVTWDISDEGQPETPQPAITALQGLNNINFAPGASFKVIYNDGEFSEIKTVADEIDNLTISNFNHNLKDTQVIVLRYQDIYFNAVVTVSPKDLYSIELAPDFAVPDVTEGMPLDLRQAKIIVTYYHDMGTPDPGDDIILPPTIVSLASGMTDYNKADGRLGLRPVIITFSYTGSRTETRELNFDLTVKKKQLDSIGMGLIPKTKYVELDQYDYTNGTIILYYNNNTTLVLPLSEAKRVRSAANILPTDHYILNYGQFDNSDFSGFSRKQQIFITYKDGDIIRETSYDIIMHDRMYAEVVFADREEYNADLRTYYFWYGEHKTISYQILGYSYHTDMPQSDMLAEMPLVQGINYTFKYINEQTGEEFSEWPRDAGTYKIVIVYDADSPVNNDRIHNSFIHDERTVVIRPKNIHIAPNSVTKVYGENHPTFTSIISAVEYREISGGGTEIILHTDNVFGYDDTAATLGPIEYLFPDSGGISDWKRAPARTYEINVSVAPHRNYAVTFGEAEYIITKRDIVIMADSQSKEYGQPDPAFTFTTAAVMGNDKSGLIQGDSFSGYLLRSNASTSNGVGSYDILLGSLRNDNYNITYVSSRLTIVPRKLIITAKNYTKIYGETLPIFEVTPSSERETPFAYTDSILSLGGSLSFVCVDNEGNAVSSATGVGTYTIMPQGYVSSNYDIEYRSGTITINRRKVSVTADEKQKIYGTAGDPALTYVASTVVGDIRSGLYASDTLNGVLIRESGENASTYTINQGTLTNENNANYDIIYTSNVFTITKRDAKIELSGLSRQYNGLLPAVTDDDITLHNAHGDIKNNITITFINPSSNVGIYSIGFTNNDPNHTLSFLAAEGYRFTITQKEVSTQFYNIPYGILENGQYTGSVYKGSPYNYEARVPVDQIASGDTVSVVIYTAELLEGSSTPIYLDRTSVTNVGRYSVKVMSLTNPNYKLRTPLPDEPDYRETQFTIIPAIIKVKINTYEKPYTGGDLSFNNSLTKIDGYYKSLDYQLLTQINFVPHGLSVYPYYINAQQQERLPRSVLYKTDEEGNPLTDEFGEYILDSYNIKVVTGNRNYTAVLVDSAGNPLELDGEEIVDENYRFKVTPKVLDIILQTGSVIKEYDGKPPQVTTFGLSSPQIDKEQEVFFEYVRNDDYPEFMEGHITDADSGTFTIIPRTTNMNFKLRLSPSTNYDYTIKVKTLYSCDFGGKTIKQYDGLVPEITSEFFNFGGYAGDYTEEERSGLVVELDFGEEAINAGSYKFTAKFKFPRGDAQFRPGYEDYLDYNHRFQSIDLLTNLDYKIEKRQVALTMIETNDLEGYNWKYYNGLNGAQLIDGTNKFARGFEIVDAKANDPDFYDYMNEPLGGMLEHGEEVKRKHRLNEQDTILLKDLIAGVLELEISSIRAAETYSAVRTSNITNHIDNANFAIQVMQGTYRFSIRRQVINYHFDETYKTYGENITTSQYNFALQPLELEKVIEAAEYPDLFDAETGLFPSTRFSPYAMDGEIIVDYMTPVGRYDIHDDDNGGIPIGNYILYHNAEASRGNLIIERRELPVRYVEDRGDYFVVTRVYGDELDKINFVYLENTGDGKGLMSWDRDIGLTTSAEFDRPNVSFVPGIGDDIARDAGIILENAIEIDFLDEGSNANYYFSYDAFFGIQPKLEIKKAPLIIKVAHPDYDGTNDPSLTAVYGTPPTESQYKYVYDGFKLGQNHLTVSVMNIQYTLQQTTMVINGETVTFDAVSGSIDMSGRSLMHILGTNFRLPVNYDEGVLPNPLTPDMSYRGTISRQATNGNWYEFSPTTALAAYLTNYDVIYDPTDYIVTKRPIEIWLEHRDSGAQGPNATFNILWDEVPYMISNEKVLLHFFTKEELLNMRYNEIAIINAIYSTEEILLLTFSKEQILIFAGKIAEDNEFDEAQMESMYNLLQAYELTQVFEEHITELHITNIYNGLTEQQFEQAYQAIFTEENINTVYAAQNYTSAQLDAIHADIISGLDEDEKRLIFRFMYDSSQLVYGDEIAIGGDIDISNIALNYNTARGENKSLTAKGVVGNNYEFIYVGSKLNIYRYITSIGDNNELPNIMLTQDDEFMVKVNYVDGSFEYLSFTAPRATDYDKQVDYSSEFRYEGAPIDMLSTASFQTVIITIDEEIFGYKQFSITSEPFRIRLFNNGDDQLLWGKAVGFGGENNGGVFASSNGAKQLGEKINGNYTYYLSNDNGVTAGMHDFDIIDTTFTLSPKTGIGSYYFELILNGDGTAQNYLAMRFNSGSTEVLTLYGRAGGAQVFSNSIVKPAELDLFDGRPHSITVYIDKLGTRESDASGYRVLAVIDNVYYFSFAIGKSYTPYFDSAAGFEANNCFAWVSRYNVYRQGIESSLALTVMPTSSSYLSQFYSVPEAREVDFAALVDSYTFFNSSYKTVINMNKLSFEYVLDGFEVGSSAMLPIGAYVLEAKLYYDGVYMDTLTIHISISQNYTAETVSNGYVSAKPYMANPVTYYGYSYAEGDDMTITATSLTTVTAANLKNYRYFKSVFELDFATLPGGDYPNVELPEDYNPNYSDKWQYQYSAAIILKTTDPTGDLRNPNITSPLFNGIGLYIRYDGSVYYTKVFIRINGLLYYSQDYTNIIWSGTQRTIVEASFDDTTGCIYIYVHNDGITYSLRIGNGFQTIGLALTANQIMNIITNTASTSSIVLSNTRGRIYQMETGTKQIRNRNYYDLATGELKANIDITAFTTGNQIFLDNGSGAPLVANYDTYTMKFKATYDDPNYINADYFRMLIGSNKPTFANTVAGDNRGFFIGYQKMYYPEFFLDAHVLYFAIYKCGAQYTNQYLYATSPIDGIPNLGPNLMDGAEHTLEVYVSREIMIRNYQQDLANGEVVPYFAYDTADMQVYLVTIKIDGTSVGTAYLPVVNNLSNWSTGGGSSTDLRYDGIYDIRFLSSYMYAGINVLNANLEVEYLRVE